MKFKNWIIIKTFINTYAITQRLLVIFKPKSADKGFNHKTGDKATHVGSTALTFMFLLNGEIFKNKVRILLVHFKILTYSSAI